MATQNAKDRDTLRALARQVADIAALPEQGKTIALWKGLNALRPARPMVAIDQMPWHEMDVDGELVLTTEDPFCRGLETRLRRTLYLWKRMRADMVVEPFVTIPKVIRGAHYGIGVREETAVLDPANDVIGHAYLDQLKNEDDIEKIQMADPVLDAEATARVEERARDIFDGILEVRMEGLYPWYTPWDRITEWRSPEALLWDLVERPEFSHRMMRRLVDAFTALLDRAEERNLLGRPQSWIHCTGAFSDELPAAGFDPAHVRAKDLWTAGMAQIFSSVSPAMHDEYEIEYAIPWYARFGLGYYGCCEPLDRKVAVIRRLPNVRKISMSPWVEVERGAEAIGPDYVFSRKPSPAFLAVDAWSPAAVERDLRATADACKRHGSPLEFILKDISTVRYEPRRLWEWTEIAMRIAREAGA